MARQREFDQEKVLEQAMLVFWKQGYEGTSVRDLIAATNISSSSMYEVFGDKRCIYLAVLARYCTIEQGQILEMTQAAPDPKTFIEMLFATLDTVNVPSGVPTGGSMAFHAMVEFGTADAEVTAELLNHYMKIIEIITQMFEHAQTKGIITTKTPPLELAYTVVSTLQGIATLKSVKPDFTHHHAVAQVLIRLLNA